LNYYGSYSNVPGYGMMWQPYFAGVGWDPFVDGAWSWYPGFGYSFVSAYPWGWTPYHYGNWSFVPGFGWMWQPGGWNSWGTVPRYTPTTLARFRAPVPPTAGTVRTVTVGNGGPVAARPPSRLIVNSGSAGMGIARGSIGNLGHLNHQVAKSGSVEVRPAPSYTAGSGRAASPGFGTSTSAGGGARSRGTMAPSAPIHSAPSAAPRSAPSPHR